MYSNINGTVQVTPSLSEINPTEPVFLDYYTVTVPQHLVDTLALIWKPIGNIFHKHNRYYNITVNSTNDEALNDALSKLIDIGTVIKSSHLMTSRSVNEYLEHQRAHDPLN